MGKVGIDVYQKGLDAYIDLMTELYELRDENERLKEMNDGLKQHMLQYQKLWTQMSFYFDDNIKSFHDLDHKDFKALKRLAKGVYDDD